MDETTKNAFGDLFKKHQQRADAAHAANAEIARKQTEFYETFRSHVASTIKPALDEVATVLRSGGCDVEVAAGTAWPGGNGERDRAISIFFSSPGKKLNRTGPMSAAHVTFNGDPTGKVSVHECTMLDGGGGSSGSRGAVSLEQCDTTYVQGRVLAVFKEGMSR